MNLELFARTVLYGSTLEEKLIQADISSEAGAIAKPVAAPPKFPGRPAELLKSGKARFPDLSKIHEPTVRGEILHFFANHELLALELMALMLLKFPEAPHSFRLGVARTMREEQGHLRLYLSRMKDLGVSLGDLPVSSYFWDVLSPMRSPMDFVTQMSLTFEQANLDFSVFYRDEIAKTGDQATTDILDLVYREEMGHVKHGLEWFNRWRAQDPDAPAGETDWQAYRRLLPPPLTPRRAKGTLFSQEARERAGFSQTFIEELKVYTGSKGRPPVLWLYNPFCDAEIARGKPGFCPKDNLVRLTEDLEHLPMFLASEQDTVIVSKRPSLSWIAQLQDLGFETPEWVERGSALREPKFGGFHPWGWSPESFRYFSPYRERLAHTSGGNAAWCETLFSSPDFGATGIGELFSKSWSARFFAEWIQSHPSEAQALDCSGSVGEVNTDFATARERILSELASGRICAVKAPWSTSGNGVKRVLKPEELDGSLGGWIRNMIQEQGSVVIEPWLDKVHDLSIQIEVGPEQTRILEVRKFQTGKQLEYRGTFLGPLRYSFEPESMKLLQSALPAWKALARDLGAELLRRGYQGPAGLDAMIYRSSSGALCLKPLIELNPRWTMGRVALSLEEHIAPGVPAIWMFFPVREIRAQGFPSAREFADSLSAQFPLMTEAAPGNPRELRIRSGVLPTQDPSSSQEVMTLLLVGEAFSKLSSSE